MTKTIRQRQQLHGRNELLDAAYRNLGRAAFHNDLIVTAIIAVVIVAIWSL